MHVSANWLKKYLPLKITPEKLSYALNMAGLGVEKESTIDGDFVVEVEVTPNRPDALSMIGVARDLSAALNLTLTTPAVKRPKLPSAKTDVTIEDEKGCLRYIGALVEGVNIAEAPAEMKKLLSAIGTRSINNAVDITNYCLMEWGQPLHAFDHDKLIGGKIIVRRAKAGEKIVTIDGVERALDPSILVIADARRPVAIAGIMGGKDTEVTAATKNILLESAYFDPVLIRLAGRKLGLGSDSSYRFERGVDLSTVETGALRALALIAESAGGKLSAYNDVKVVKSPKSAAAIRISAQEIEGRLGCKIPPARIKTILQKLGCRILGPGPEFNIVPPSSRADLKQPVDIIEEVARVYGYDKLPSTLPPLKAASIPVSEKRRRKRTAAQALLGLGFDEAITFSMVSRADLERTLIPVDGTVKIQNPLSKEQEILRPSLLPSLLAVLQINLNRGQKNIRVFELGKRYFPAGERETLGILATGMRGQDWRESPKKEIDFFDLKGAVERVLRSLKAAECSFEPMSCPFLHAGLAAEVKLGADPVGIVGKVSAGVLKNWDIKHRDVYFAGLDLDKVFTHIRPARRFEPIAEFPAVVRDVSLAVKADVPFSRIAELIAQQKVEFLKSVNFLEEYVGEKIPAGQRGLVFSLVYQSSARTLREEEVTAAHEKICKELVERLGAVRR